MPVVFEKKQSLAERLNPARSQDKRIGFVPTMGALHQGHLSLLKRAKEENGLTVCSIFVNPTQFNQPEDYSRYPRNLKKDLDLLEAIGVDVVFAPTKEEMYPQNEPQDVPFNPGFLGQVMEGEHRPGHFSGVATIVKKLLDTVQPDRAYFGQKDYQQYLIIRKLVDDYRMPVEVVLSPTVRAESGLALSSRNERLSEEQRQQATALYRLLQEAAQRWKSGVSAADLQQWGLQHLEQDTALKPEYFCIVNAATLQPIKEGQQEQQALIATAAWIGGVRLIDNIIADREGR